MEQNDKNTKYFQNLVKFRKRRNVILEIETDDGIISNANELVGAFATWNLRWNKIPYSMHNQLTRSFSEREVINAINSLGKASIKKLRLGMKMKVGNGKNISLLNDPWIDRIPISRWPTFVNVSLLDKMQSVADLIENGAWNIDALQSLFNIELVKKVGLIYLEKYNSKDIWIWGFNDKGKLSSKIAYNYLKCNDKEISDELGKATHSCYSYMSVSDPLSIEIWAIWLSIIKAKALNIKYIKVFTDCLRAMHILKEDFKALWFLKDLIKEVWKIAKFFDSIDWLHLKRTSNMDAHKLANEGLRVLINNNSQVLNFTPLYIYSSMNLL
ncbi:ribonuclease H protein [Canna indica]|uniref:Ribonuclease H protein n=1 Tax=Canna indica TaxID=4628 RepID=A0AAQ3QKZ7_9LILI|nr:ribonuclease H protein [Canna indica]